MKDCHQLRKVVRALVKRDENPSGGIIDSQPVKVAEEGLSGFANGGEKSKDEKNTLWLIL
ncbi:hypothetical protein PHSC3_001689 [Chlamydiales bacterium STE3]|nr:hypothetical protein PHSC3_001689 [Chlamydiales bacterium STE3]